MTRADIVAELRRSACEDVWPYAYCGHAAFLCACDWKVNGENFYAIKASDHLRLFFLLVAEAMND